MLKKASAIRELAKLFLFSMLCRKRNLLSLFPFHFLLSLKLLMLLQTCNFIFLALRHFLITKQFHGITTFLYKNIVILKCSKKVVGLPTPEPSWIQNLLNARLDFPNFKQLKRHGKGAVVTETDYGVFPILRVIWVRTSNSVENEIPFSCRVAIFQQCEYKALAHLNDNSSVA